MLLQYILSRRSDKTIEEYVRSFTTNCNYRFSRKFLSHWKDLHQTEHLDLSGYDICLRNCGQYGITFLLFIDQISLDKNCSSRSSVSYSSISRTSKTKNQFIPMTNLSLF